MWSNKHWGEWDDHLPQFAGCATADTATGGLGLPCCQSTLLARAQFAGILSPFSAPSQVRDITLVLTEFHEVAVGLFLQPS